MGEYGWPDIDNGGVRQEKWLASNVGQRVGKAVLYPDKTRSNTMKVQTAVDYNGNSDFGLIGMDDSCVPVRFEDIWLSLVQWEIVVWNTNVLMVSIFYKPATYSDDQVCCRLALSAKEVSELFLCCTTSYNADFIVLSHNLNPRVLCCYRKYSTNSSYWSCCIVETCENIPYIDWAQCWKQSNLTERQQTWLDWGLWRPGRRRARWIWIELVEKWVTGILERWCVGQLHNYISSSS